MELMEGSVLILACQFKSEHVCPHPVLFNHNTAWRPEISYMSMAYRVAGTGELRHVSRKMSQMPRVVSSRLIGFQTICLWIRRLLRKGAGKGGDKTALVDFP